MLLKHSLYVSSDRVHIRLQSAPSGNLRMNRAKRNSAFIIIVGNYSEDGILSGISIEISGLTIAVGKEGV